jgi:hypothetical protein
MSELPIIVGRARKSSRALLRCGLLMSVFLGAGANAETWVVQMLGSSEVVGTLADIDAREGTNIDLPGDAGTNFTCFEVPLLDPNTGIQIGSGVDCLRFDDGTAPPEDEIRLTAYSFFVTPGGTLVNSGTTSVRAFVDGFGNGGAPFPRSHLTGSVPDSNAQTFVGGTRRFDRTRGRARVSGAVDLVTGPTPFFDCLWVIELDASIRSRPAGRPSS